MDLLTETHMKLERALRSLEEKAERKEDLTVADKAAGTFALAAIALELRELREAGKRFKWMRSDRVEGSPHGTARDSADAQFDEPADG